jgi:hypothetical protein
LQLSWHRVGVEASPQLGRQGRLTKASLALLKACSSCGDRDLNWARWQSPASRRTLKGREAETALLLVSTVAIKIRRSLQSPAISVREGQQ